MPIEATLSCHPAGKLLGLLKQSPSLAARLASADEQDFAVRIDILPLLLVEDLYGKQYAPPPVADSAVWDAVATVPVLSETDLGSLEYTGYVGTWNANFLGWLKAMSQAVGEKVEIDYLHERGDYPMEYAWWSSDPTSSDRVVDVFGIEIQYDDPQWRREAIRHANGRVELRASEWPHGMRPGA